MNIKKVLVSQPKPSSEKSPYYDIAQRHGVEIVFRPFIKVEGLTAKEFRQQKINIADYTGVIFTSRHAVDNYFRLAEETRFHIPDTMKYFCTTESIALYLQKYIVYRKRKISFGKTGKLDDEQLMAAIAKNKKEKFLFPVGDSSNEDVSCLAKLHIEPTKAVMYKTVSNDFTPDEPFDYDVLLFFSPHGITSLMKNFADVNKGDKKIAIGTFGSTTAQAAKDAGLTVDMEVPSKEFLSMTAALDAFLTNNKD